MSVKLSFDASREQLVALETELAAARSRIRELEEQIETDPLVNLLNRRGFERALKRGLDYVNRYKTGAAVIFIDLDNFKSINDHYGRVAGDTVLKTVSTTIIRHVRSSDIVGRFGGDEFALLLWHTCNADARAKALDLENKIADLKIFYSAEILSITASAGIATLRPLDSPSDVIALADRSLYHRKLHRSHEVEVSSTILRVVERPAPRVRTIFLLNVAVHPVSIQDRDGVAADAGPPQAPVSVYRDGRDCEQGPLPCGPLHVATGSVPDSSALTTWWVRSFQGMARKPNVSANSDESSSELAGRRAGRA